MARTDDDSWDITESVGATALRVAAARAAETRSANRLINDPYAQLFLEAAGDGMWSADDPLDQTGKDPQLSAIEHVRVGYTASRTKFFDDFFVAAVNSGVRQAVILAAGLDARAWRLPWPEGAIVYEIDLPKVLQFKTATLKAHHANPRAQCVAVPIDLRHDWPKALRQAGFDPSRATAWAAEGLLPYLPAHAQDQVFDHIHALSATESRLAVEAFDEAFFDPAYLERHLALRQQYAAGVAQPGQTTPDNAELWYLQERTNVADWLSAHGWSVNATPAHDLMAQNHRLPPTDAQDAIPKIIFIDSRLTANAAR
ncbi:MAG TPA: SAM-dependent methyltransferase [Mycobacterium sp.]|nr:SAM-dependent methyltransferase [Mycobacterium sp.]HUH71916.1 SAM-dependent methyltransferase [Mycobacterium sp.]